ncbi:unnamed protein product [Amoebophrya sp. A25]|nr:unnamed protein product [Amoebophrya sp. A25]|eukprot:GSA25T00010152001.1
MVRSGSPHNLSVLQSQRSQKYQVGRFLSPQTGSRSLLPPDNIFCPPPPARAVSPPAGLALANAQVRASTVGMKSLAHNARGGSPQLGTRPPVNTTSGSGNRGRGFVMAGTNAPTSDASKASVATTILNAEHQQVQKNRGYQGPSPHSGQQHHRGRSPVNSAPAPAATGQVGRPLTGDYMFAPRSRNSFDVNNRIYGHPGSADVSTSVRAPPQAMRMGAPHEDGGQHHHQAAAGTTSPLIVAPFLTPTGEASSLMNQRSQLGRIGSLSPSLMRGQAQQEQSQQGGGAAVDLFSRSVSPGAGGILGSPKSRKRSRTREGRSASASREQRPGEDVDLAAQHQQRVMFEEANGTGKNTGVVDTSSPIASRVTMQNMQNLSERTERLRLMLAQAEEMRAEEERRILARSESHKNFFGRAGTSPQLQENKFSALGVLAHSASMAQLTKGALVSHQNSGTGAGAGGDPNNQNDAGGGSGNGDYLRKRSRSPKYGNFRPKKSVVRGPGRHVVVQQQGPAPTTTPSPAIRNKPFRVPTLSEERRRKQAKVDKAKAVIGGTLSRTASPSPIDIDAPDHDRSVAHQWFSASSKTNTKNLYATENGTVGYRCKDGAMVSSTRPSTTYHHFAEPTESAAMHTQSTLEHRREVDDRAWSKDDLNMPRHAEQLYESTDSPGFPSPLRDGAITGIDKVPTSKKFLERPGLAAKKHVSLNRAHEHVAPMQPPTEKVIDRLGIEGFRYGFKNKENESYDKRINTPVVEVTKTESPIGGSASIKAVRLKGFVHQSSTTRMSELERQNQQAQARVSGTDEFGRVSADVPEEFVLEEGANEFGTVQLSADVPEDLEYDHLGPADEDSLFNADTKWSRLTRETEQSRRRGGSQIMQEDNSNGYAGTVGAEGQKGTKGKNPSSKKGASKGSKMKGSRTSPRGLQKGGARAEGSVSNPDSGRLLVDRGLLDVVLEEQGHGEKGLGPLSGLGLGEGQRRASSPPVVLETPVNGGSSFLPQQRSSYRGSVATPSTAQTILPSAVIVRNSEQEGGSSRFSNRRGSGPSPLGYQTSPSMMKELRESTRLSTGSAISNLPDHVGGNNNNRGSRHYAQPTAASRTQHQGVHIHSSNTGPGGENGGRSSRRKDSISGAPPNVDTVEQQPPSSASKMKNAKPTPDSPSLMAAIGRVTAALFWGERETSNTAGEGQGGARHSKTALMPDKDVDAHRFSKGTASSGLKASQKRSRNAEGENSSPRERLTITTPSGPPPGTRLSESTTSISAKYNRPSSPGNGNGGNLPGGLPSAREIVGPPLMMSTASSIPLPGGRQSTTTNKQGGGQPLLREYMSKMAALHAEYGAKLPANVREGIEQMLVDGVVASRNTRTTSSPGRGGINRGSNSSSTRGAAININNGKSSERPPTGSRTSSSTTTVPAPPVDNKLTQYMNMVKKSRISTSSIAAAAPAGGRSSVNKNRGSKAGSIVQVGGGSATFRRPKGTGRSLSPSALRPVLQQANTQQDHDRGMTIRAEGERAAQEDIRAGSSSRQVELEEGGSSASTDFGTSADLPDLLEQLPINGHGPQGSVVGLGGSSSSITSGLRGLEEQKAELEKHAAALQKVAIPAPKIARQIAAERAKWMMRSASPPMLRSRDQLAITQGKVAIANHRRQQHRLESGMEGGDQVRDFYAGTRVQDGTRGPVVLDNNAGVVIVADPTTVATDTLPSSPPSPEQRKKMRQLAVKKSLARISDGGGSRSPSAGSPTIRPSSQQAGNTLGAAVFYSAPGESVAEWDVKALQDNKPIDTTLAKKAPSSSSRLATSKGKNSNGGRVVRKGAQSARGESSSVTASTSKGASSRMNKGPISSTLVNKKSLLPPSSTSDSVKINSCDKTVPISEEDVDRALSSSSSSAKIQLPNNSSTPMSSTAPPPSTSAQRQKGTKGARRKSSSKGPSTAKSFSARGAETLRSSPRVPTVSSAGATSCEEQGSGSSNSKGGKTNVAKVNSSISSFMCAETEVNLQRETEILTSSVGDLVGAEDPEARKATPAETAATATVQQPTPNTPAKQQQNKPPLQNTSAAPNPSTISSPKALNKTPPLSSQVKRFASQLLLPSPSASSPPLAGASDVVVNSNACGSSSAVFSPPPPQGGPRAGSSSPSRSGQRFPFGGVEPFRTAQRRTSAAGLVKEQEAIFMTPAVEAHRLMTEKFRERAEPSCELRNLQASPVVDVGGDGKNHANSTGGPPRREQELLVEGGAFKSSSSVNYVDIFETPVGRGYQEPGTMPPAAVSLATPAQSSKEGTLSCMLSSSNEMVGDSRLVNGDGEEMKTQLQEEIVQDHMHLESPIRKWYNSGSDPNAENQLLLQTRELQGTWTAGEGEFMSPNLVPQPVLVHNNTSTLLHDTTATLLAEGVVLEMQRLNAPTPSDLESP